jgi:hypothetical protein
MTTLAKLAKPQAKKVSLDGGDIDVFPLKLGDIAALLARHPVLIAGFSAVKSDPKVIAAAILKSGQSAVSDVIDAATRSPEGTAAEAGLTAFDEAEILVACIDATLPKDEARLGKFLIELDALMTRLGLNDLPETE